MPSSQELTRRIKSVKSTRKITRAMQLVSAAKMRRSQAATLASRTYAGMASDLIRALGNVGPSGHPLLQRFDSADKIAVILVSTNRGLVGSFNTNLLVRLRTLVKEHPDKEIEVITIGRKGKEGVLRTDWKLAAEFPKYDSTEHIKEIYPLVKLITEEYKNGKYSQIFVLYNHFVSTLQQKPEIQTLLPFVPITGLESKDDVIYEPDKDKVIEDLLPRILESQIYQAILENDASEHSARMLMMKNATDAAGDLISDLTLTYNQLRQNKITTELSEITAGKLALENN